MERRKLFTAIKDKFKNQEQDQIQILRPPYFLDEDGFLRYAEDVEKLLFELSEILNKELKKYRKI